MLLTYNRKEILIILRSSFIRVFNLSVFTISLPTMMFVVFSVYASLEGIESVTPRRVFISLSLLSVVKYFSNFLFVSAVTQLSEMLVAVKRVEVRYLCSIFSIYYISFICLEISAAR